MLKKIERDKFYYKMESEVKCDQKSKRIDERH